MSRSRRIPLLAVCLAANMACADEKNVGDGSSDDGGTTGDGGSGSDGVGTDSGGSDDDAGSGSSDSGGSGTSGTQGVTDTTGPLIPSPKTCAAQQTQEACEAVPSGDTRCLWRHVIPVVPDNMCEVLEGDSYDACLYAGLPIDICEPTMFCPDGRVAYAKPSEDGVVLFVLDTYCSNLLGWIACGDDFAECQCACEIEP